MSRRNWLLFVTVGLMWGIPYLFIRIAVREFSPASVVFARVVIGAAILVPISIKQGTFKSAFKGIKWIALYALFEMIGPWFLITKAETRIPSGLTGLLVATVPIWSTVFTAMHGDKSVWHAKRLFGIIIGFIGIVALVGIESFSGSSPLWAIFFVLISSVGYAYAVIMITRALPDVSGIAINAVAMSITALVYAPFAALQWPRHSVSFSAIFAVVVLGVICTALAFIVFFALLNGIGAARGSLITYLNTAFAVMLGVIFLSEPFTLGIGIGLPMVLIGSYFASYKPRKINSLQSPNAQAT